MPLMRDAVPTLAKVGVEQDLYLGRKAQITPTPPIPLCPLRLVGHPLILFLPHFHHLTPRPLSVSDHTAYTFFHNT